MRHRHHPDVVWENDEDRVVATAPTVGEVVILDGTAALIWDCLDGATTDEIVRDVSDATGAPEASFAGLHFHAGSALRTKRPHSGGASEGKRRGARYRHHQLTPRPLSRPLRHSASREGPYAERRDADRGLTNAPP